MNLILMTGRVRTDWKREGKLGKGGFLRTRGRITSNSHIHLGVIGNVSMFEIVWSFMIDRNGSHVSMFILFFHDHALRAFDKGMMPMVCRRSMPKMDHDLHVIIVT